MIQLDEVEKLALERAILEAERAYKRRQVVIRDVILRHGGDPAKQVLDVVDLPSGMAEIRDREPQAVGPKILVPDMAVRLPAVEGAE